jgi:hypothetical protein
MEMWHYILGGLIIAPFELLVVYLISKTIPKPKREKMKEEIGNWGRVLGYVALVYITEAAYWIKRNVALILLVCVIAISFYLLGAL